jgi:small subunit ribosomal protein S1
MGRITKVVTFGAFAEILPGVEGLIHISELAEHHVENPREIVQQGEEYAVKVIEIDPERRRLSLSIKRVGEGETGRRLRLDDGPGGAPAEEPVPDLGLSDEVFAQADAEAAAAPVAEDEPAEAAPELAEEPAEPEAAAEPEPEEDAPTEPEAEAPAEPEAEAPVEPEAEAAEEPAADAEPAEASEAAAEE